MPLNKIILKFRQQFKVFHILNDLFTQANATETFDSPFQASLASMIFLSQS